MTSIKTVTAIAFATILATIGVGTHTVNAAESTASLQAQLQQAQSTLDDINTKASAKAIAIQAAQTKIKDATAKINTYNVKITKAQAEVNKRTANMKAQLRSLQKEAGESVTGNVYFDFILNAKSLDDAVSRSFTVGKLNQANQQALQDVQTAAKDLAAVKQAALDNKATLVASEAQLEKDQDQLKSLASQASSKQAALQAKINANQAAVKALQGDTAKANAQAKAKATAKPAAKTTAVKATGAIQAAATPVATASSSNASGSLAGAIGTALAQIGVPYAWGGSTPAGFDCSGLVAYAAASAGVSLPRTSQQQSTVGHMVSLSALQPGDLLFWGGVGSATHVALYIGGGRYVHAPQPGQSVTTQSMSYYRPSFARRL
ncbi:C40 family peptidase [Lacticaseibacillus sp. N501-2]|uniref:C40 family peptidase n=1 Tax=Lacticaseibacillus salsurae TaxID=3367729 RepID=UPI0038B2DAF4